MTRKLEIATPSAALVDAYLGEIAKGYGIDWSPPPPPPPSAPTDLKTKPDHDDPKGDDGGDLPAPSTPPPKSDKPLPKSDTKAAIEDDSEEVGALLSPAKFKNDSTTKLPDVPAATTTTGAVSTLEPPPSYPASASASGSSGGKGYDAELIKRLEALKRK